MGEPAVHLRRRDRYKGVRTDQPTEPRPRELHVQRSRLRLLLFAVLSAMLSVALVAPVEARPRHTHPDRIDLPLGFQPEGITIGKRPMAYVGSLRTGNISTLIRPTESR